jgi:hypothetical protein
MQSVSYSRYMYRVLVAWQTILFGTTLALMIIFWTPQIQAQSLNLEAGRSITSGIGENFSGSLTFWMPIAHGWSGSVGYTRWTGSSSNKERILDPANSIIVENTTGPIFWGNQAFTAQVLYALVNQEFFRLHLGGGAFVHEKIALVNINANTALPQILREKFTIETTFTASLIMEYLHSELFSFTLRGYYAGPGFITEAKHFGIAFGAGIKLW